jgi:predicted O-linked N-acetylglucosamine transferase (SPINDLY family)
VDAFVSMRDAEPDLDDPPYTERLYVQDAPNLYYPAVGVEPDVGRAELGLPRGRLYGCPQTLFKLHPEFDAALLGVLDRDPEGVLVLHEGTVPEWRTILLDRLEAARPGVSARVHWLRSMPRGRFIQTVAALDVMLDPFPFGGGNTTIEALGVGTPVVTLPPRYARGRLTYTFCKRSGWMDGVATDVDDYCRRAVALASPADAAAQRRAIRERAQVLFEDDAGPRELESVLERMAEDHAAG